MEKNCRETIKINFIFFKNIVTLSLIKNYFLLIFDQCTFFLVSIFIFISSHTPSKNILFSTYLNSSRMQRYTTNREFAKHHKFEVRETWIQMSLQYFRNERVKKKKDNRNFSISWNQLKICAYWFKFCSLWKDLEYSK